MVQIEIAPQLRAVNKRFYEFLIKDLMELEEDKADSQAHPEFRSAIKMVAHCAGSNRYFAALLADDSAPQSSPEERQAFVDAVATRAEAIAALKSSTEELYAAIDGVGAERWDDVVESGLGPMTKMVVAIFSALHSAYHDGQLNHLHIMNGDKDMHWF